MTDTDRPALLARRPEAPCLRDMVPLLWTSYDAAVEQEEQWRQRLVALAKQEEVVRRFVALPGVGWIRAATLYAYLDTPWRFRSKAAAPQRALLRVGADRVVAKAQPDKNYLEWYFTPAVRKLGQADDWPAFRAWYEANRDYLRSERSDRGSLVLDEEAKAFGVAAQQPEFLRTAVAALREGGARAESAAKLLRRYAPDGPEGVDVEAWQRWWQANEKYLFFSEAGWYRWYVDPLAKQRGIPTADLRGQKRASR